MRQLVRVGFTGTFALALLALLLCAVAPAHAWLTEIDLNSSTVQITPEAWTTPQRVSTLAMPKSATQL